MPVIGSEGSASAGGGPQSSLEIESNVTTSAAQVESGDGGNVTTSQVESKEETNVADNAAAQVAPNIETNPADLSDDDDDEEYFLAEYYIGEKYNVCTGEDNSDHTRTNIDVVEDLIEKVEEVKENPPSEEHLENLRPIKTDDIGEDKAVEGETGRLDEVYISEDKAVEGETGRLDEVIICKEKEVEGILENFELVEINEDISDTDIGQLFRRASSNHYEATAKDLRDGIFLSRCAALMKRDYRCVTLNNLGGSLSWNYPASILIPVAKSTYDPNSSDQISCDENSKADYFCKNFKKYAELARSAAIARCRCRFPVPVMLLNRKFICRSGTLAVRKGAAYETIRRGSEPESKRRCATYSEYASSLISQGVKSLTAYIEKIKNAVSQDVQELKKVDVLILRILKISFICDMMIENRKIHTGVRVSSSEKINLAVYGEFKVLPLPYPGCEFFAEYSKQRCGISDIDWTKLHFNWGAPEVDSTLKTPKEENLPSISGYVWDDYKNYNLKLLTKMYFRLIIHFVDKAEGGLLFHCISGWDRTPLFISLLRISLWADNLIHESLTVNQMAYLTLGYDWYLFGHHLPNRLKKREEIMHFCFKFLPEIESTEFSLEKEPDEKRRQERIRDLSKKLLQAYEENIPLPAIDCGE